MPKTVKITERTIDMIMRNADVKRDVLKNHLDQYFMISMNHNSIAYPWIIWKDEQVRRYYSFIEPEQYHKFNKVKRNH